MPDKVDVSSFLKSVNVSNKQQAMANSISAALQHNLTYRQDKRISKLKRKEFRDFWAELIKKKADGYKNAPNSDTFHCDTILKICKEVSYEYGGLLHGETLRFGTSQKAFNLYLKFLWLLDIDNFPVPPHCPVDGIVLKKVNIKDSWTKSNSKEKYMDWIIEIRNVMKANNQSNSSLSEWEFSVWNKSVREGKKSGKH
jgi:hypothetical protein